MTNVVFVFAFIKNKIRAQFIYSVIGQMHADVLLIQ